MIALIIILFFGTFMFYASYSIKSNVYVKAFCKKETSEKVVAITFDDGPDAVQTLKILDVLKEYKIQACFFCIGSRVENNEKLIQRMVREGHLIDHPQQVDGAQTQRHPLHVFFQEFGDFLHVAPAWLLLTCSLALRLVACWGLLVYWVTAAGF